MKGLPKVGGSGIALCLSETWEEHRDKDCAFPAGKTLNSEDSSGGGVLSVLPGYVPLSFLTLPRGLNLAVFPKGLQKGLQASPISNLLDCTSWVLLSLHTPPQCALVCMSVNNPFSSAPLAASPLTLQQS